MIKKRVKNWFWSLLLLIEFVFDHWGWKITEWEYGTFTAYAVARTGRLTGRKQTRAVATDWETVNGN